MTARQRTALIALRRTLKGVDREAMWRKIVKRARLYRVNPNRKPVDAAAKR